MFLDINLCCLIGEDAKMHIYENALKTSMIINRK